MKERENFSSNDQFFLFCTRRVRSMAEANGNDTTLLSVLEKVLVSQPYLLSDVITQTNEIALKQLGQNRWNTSSMILYVETALRTIASQEESNLLYPSKWNPDKVVEYLNRYAEDIANLAGENALGRNLPQRAAWMIYLLSRENLLSEKTFFIELGAASGYILDALAYPNKFWAWLKTTNANPQVSINKICEKTAGQLGIDLCPPTNKRWSLASLGDDEVIQSVESFTTTFKNTSNVLRGDILSQDTWTIVENQTQKAASQNQIPVIIASEMLYQINSDGRTKICEQIKNLISYTNGYFLRSDGGQYMELPQYELFTVAELRNPQWKIISPQLLLKDKYRCKWTEIQ